MYKVFADGEILCSSEAEELALLDPIVNLEANCAGSFTFKMPPDHPFYDALTFRQTLIDVYLDDELIFEGVPVSDSTDFYNVKTVECEGELSFLNDSIQGQEQYTNQSVSTLLAAYLQVHNDEVDTFKQFQLGMVTVAGGSSMLRYTNFQTTMQEISEDLVDNYGGYLRVRHDNGVRYLDYLEASPRTSTQVIQIGKNLMDLVQNTSTLDICTVLIPLGAKTGESQIEGLDERLTIESVNDGKNFIIGTGAAYFGYVWRTATWDDVTVPANLLAKGQAYLADAQWANLVITATAYDLGLAVEDVQKFRVLDTIRVVSEPHGLDRNFMLTALQIDLNHPGNTQITLGSEQTLSLSAQSAAMTTEINNQTTRVLTSAAVNARQILENATGGNIHFVYDEDGVCTEILIMDTNSLATATRIWRWNINGWGYSGDGGQTYTVAATMDGAIFANFVRAGVLQDAATMGNTFYLDLDNGILRAAFDQLTITGQTVPQIANSAVNNFVQGQYAQDMADLQSQIDGQIESYFDNYVPTTSNAPASSWTTTALKDDHLGDLFYVINNQQHGGECYRWVKDGSTYKWQLVEASAVATALQKALDAEALAGTKRRVFTTTPTTPYDVGDLWIDTQTGEIMYAITAKTSAQSYAASDWSKAGDYVTDGSLTQQDIFNRLTNNGQTQGIYLSNNKLYINATYIQSGTLEGIEVRAGSGNIGGWKINTNGLTKDVTLNDTDYQSGMWAPSEPNSTTPAFYVGYQVSNNNWEYVFKVDYTGKLTCKSGEIGGFSVDGSTIYRRPTLGGKTYEAGIWAPKDNIIQLTSPAFYVQNKTDNVYPFQVTYEGELTSTKGNIGGWTIEEHLVSKEATINNDTYQVGIYAPGIPSSNNSAFYVWNRTQDDYPFRVRYDGKLFATGAVISGTITATGGAIGGWTISRNGLTKDVTFDNTNYQIGLWAPPTPLSTSPAFYVGYPTGNIWNYPFKVDYKGTLTAIGATISGTINMTGGSINMVTSSQSDDKIKLSYSDWTVALSPLECDLYNSSTDKYIKIQAGGIFGRTNASSLTDSNARDSFTLQQHSSLGGALYLYNTSGNTGMVYSANGMRTQVSGMTTMTNITTVANSYVNGSSYTIPSDGWYYLKGNYESKGNYNLTYVACELYAGSVYLASRRTFNNGENVWSVNSREEVICLKYLTSGTVVYARVNSIQAGAVIGTQIEYVKL